MLVVSLIISDLSLGKFYRLHMDESSYFKHAGSKRFNETHNVEGSIWMDEKGLILDSNSLLYRCFLIECLGGSLLICYS